MHGEDNLFLIPKPVGQEPHLGSDIETTMNHFVVLDHDYYYFIRSTSK